MQYHLAVIAMLAIVGCGGPQTTNLAPASSQEVLSQAPNWYLSVPHDSDHLNAVGSATSRDMNTAVEKAKMLARNDLAQQLSTDLGSLTKQFQQETGLGDESQFLTQFSSAVKAVSAHPPAAGVDRDLTGMTACISMN